MTMIPSLFFLHQSGLTFTYIMSTDTYSECQQLVSISNDLCLDCHKYRYMFIYYLYSRLSFYSHKFERLCRFKIFGRISMISFAIGDR